MAIKLTRPSGGNFQQTPTPKLFRNIAVTFVLITVAVIAIALWTSSVRAVITVKAKPQTVSTDTVIDIAQSPSSGQIKGKVVSGTFTESSEFAVAVVTSTPVTTSTVPVKTNGTVKIINNYSKDQTLVVKTRLLTASGKLFRITKTVNVPAGGSLQVDAVSDQPGSEYELSAGQRLIIPGLWSELQSLIYAESVTDFSQGISVNPANPEKVITDQAFNDAYQTLYTAALNKAKDSLSMEAGVDSNWESVYLIGNTQKQSNAAVGQKTDSFLAQVKVTVTAVFFPKEDVIALLHTRLNDKLPEGYSINDPDLSKASFKLESADPVKNTAQLAVSVEAESRLSVDSSELRKDLIVGLADDEVIRKWSALDGVDEVDIDLQPSWVHRLPSMKDKITVIVK